MKPTAEKTREYTTKYRLKHPARRLVQVAKARAKQRGLEFNLDYSDVVVPDICPILGIPMEVHVNTGAGGKDNSYSLDRIDSNKGYIKGNVQVISHKANSMKFTATKEELLKFANWIQETYS